MWPCCFSGERRFSRWFADDRGPSPGREEPSTHHSRAGEGSVRWTGWLGKSLIGPGFLVEYSWREDLFRHGCLALRGLSRTAPDMHRADGSSTHRVQANHLGVRHECKVPSIRSGFCGPDASGSPRSGRRLPRATSVAGTERMPGGVCGSSWQFLVPSRRRTNVELIVTMSSGARLLL